MKYSKVYVPTSKDVMQETEALNYRLLYKAGFIRKNAAGVFSFLPFGSRVMDRLEELIEGTLEASGCYKINLPNNVTIEDLLHNILAARLSYKELPMGAWLVKEKSSNIVRARLGLLQPKVWQMIEGFKLVEDRDALSQAHKLMADHFRKMLNDLSIEAVEAERLSWGCIGEMDSVLLLPYENGEDSIASCRSCGKIAMADSMPCSPTMKSTDAGKELVQVYTPQVKTIAEVAEFLNTEAASIVKTLIYKADNKLYGVLIRGDRDLSEFKLKKLLKCRSLRAATAQEVYDATTAEVGFAGPIGLKVEIICDYEVAALSNVVVGANKTDYHYVNAALGRDFLASAIADLRSCSEQDQCDVCGGDIIFSKGFILGTIGKNEGQYLERQGLVFVNNEGNMEQVYMMDFAFNLHRLLAAIVERHHDSAGLLLPRYLAPYEAVVMAVHQDNEEQTAAAVQIYHTLRDMNYDVLLDDRAERASVKFKDFELVGIPLRITVGRKIGEGIVELKYRDKEMQEIHVSHLIDHLLSHEVQHAEEA